MNTQIIGALGVVATVALSLLSQVGINTTTTGVNTQESLKSSVQAQQSENSELLHRLFPKATNMDGSADVNVETSTSIFEEKSGQEMSAQTQASMQTDANAHSAAPATIRIGL